MEFLLGTRKASGKVTFTANPVNTDQIVLDDGVNTALTYEFYDVTMPADPKIGVLIGATKEDTAANLLTAIHAQVATIEEVDPEVGIEGTIEGAEIILHNTLVGDHGNVDITTTESSECMTISGMDGGFSSKELDVHVGDQTTPIIIAPFSNRTNDTTLAITAAQYAYTFTVADATGIAIGSYLTLFHPPSVRFSQFYCTAITGPLVTVDSPMDFAYPAGTYVDIGTTEMAVDGSRTPKVFGLRGVGSPPGIELEVDITRVIFSCITATPVDLSLFGDLARLTRGLLLRKRDGTTWNIFNVKDNKELSGIMYDWTPFAASNPSQGVDGFSGRLTFAGPSKIGVASRLKLGEDLEILVQDNLSGLTSFSIVAEGHIVDTRT
jgi:hypothetical protein